MGGTGVGQGLGRGVVGRKRRGVLLAPKRLGLRRSRPAGTGRTHRPRGRLQTNGPRAAGRGKGAVRGAQSNTGVSTPNTLCSLGLVVVYWRWILPLSGKMMAAAAKAASAHSWKPERMSFFLPG